MFFDKLNKSGSSNDKNNPQDSSSISKTTYTTKQKVIKTIKTSTTKKVTPRKVLAKPNPIRPRHSSEPIKTEIVKRKRVKKATTVESSPISSDNDQKKVTPRKRKTPKTFVNVSPDESSDEEENWQLSLKRGPSSTSVTAAQSPASDSDFDNGQLNRNLYFDGESTGDIISSAKLLSESKSKYKPLFTTNNHNIVLELPFGNEEYPLLIPVKSDEANPIDEIILVFELVASAFVPRNECDLDIKITSDNDKTTTSNDNENDKHEKTTTKLIPSYLIKHPSNQDCILRRLRRSIKNNDSDKFYKSIDEFNNLIISLRNSGLIKSTLLSLPALPTPVTYEFLNQVYRRVVSPSTRQLRDYKAFSSNVYGELLPKFVTEIFKKTRITPSSVFMDLGSGVGNCVLQAALEIGCESWGCEIMKHASELAIKQKNELERRVKGLYHLNIGEINVCSADFVQDPQILSNLKRVDVLLVNNYAFDAKLNSKLIDMFLDLKDGCKIVSLRTFIPTGYVITKHNRESPINILRVEKHRFPNDAVSWTTNGGDFYIATVDRSRLSLD